MSQTDGRQKTNGKIGGARGADGWEYETDQMDISDVRHREHGEHFFSVLSVCSVEKILREPNAAVDFNHFASNE